VEDGIFIGVDLGGTNVRARAYNAKGEPVGQRFQNPSRAQEGTQAILDQVTQTIHQASASAGGHTTAVGMAIPGHIDNEAGLVRWAPNFGGTVNGVFINWENVPIREPLSKNLSMPIFMDNDANLAALGEYKYGSGKDSANCLVMVTLGTGVGGGVILSPKSVVGNARGPLMLVGGNKGGAELGHIAVHAGGLLCNSGAYGALEAHCQRDAIIARAQGQLKRGRKSVILDLVEGELGKVTPKIVSLAAEKGDAVAIEVWAEVGEALGWGLGSIINTFAPDVLAIGGSIAHAGDFLIQPAIKSAEKVAIPSLFRDVRIGMAEQINDAGMLGGAALAVECSRW
jgi:glucokinase